MKFLRLLAIIVAASSACTPRLITARSPDFADKLIQMNRRWWGALPEADTTYLRKHSAAGVVVTLSSGKSLGIDSLVRTYATKRHDIVTEWADESIRSHD